MIRIIDFEKCLGNKIFDIADAAHVDRDVLSDLGDIYIDLNDLCFLSPLLCVLCDTVAESRSESDDQVSLVDGFVRRDGSVHSDHPEVLVVIISHDAGRHERVDCRDLGLAPLCLNNTFSSTSIKHGYQLAQQLFSQPLDYTAIFAATDTNALGVIQAAEEKGIRIPQDLSLLGFDNIRDGGLPRIGLTTIEQPKKLLASMAVDSLLDKIENEMSGYTHRVLSPSLVERETCRKI